MTVLIPVCCPHCQSSEVVRHGKSTNGKADKKGNVEESELDEMWSYVSKKGNPRWLWHAIDRQTGQVLAYVFGRRNDEAFLQVKRLLEPFGIKRFCTDKWGAY